MLIGVLGKRRALKGFVGDVPDAVKVGDKLNLLNMGGVIGVCKGHHSSLSDAIEVEVLGIAVNDAGEVLNIGDNALKPATSLAASAPVVVVANTGNANLSDVRVTATDLRSESAVGLVIPGQNITITPG